MTCRSKGGEVIAGQTRDISVGGMFIESQGTPAFGTELTIEMVIPGSKEKNLLPAVVRWSTDAGFGVQFGLLGARDTHAITTLLEKNL